jgi:uncharacterized membrane protein
LVNNKRDKYPFIFVGLLILIVGWVSIFSGFAQVILAEDFEFFIQVEEMLLVKQIIPESDFVLFGVIRIIFGLLLVFIGNSFLLASKSVNERMCKPCFDDLRRIKNGK